MKKIILFAACGFILINGILAWKIYNIFLNSSSHQSSVVDLAPVHVQEIEQKQEVADDISLDKNAFRLGFTSLNKKQNNFILPVQGTIPDWLSGTLLRVGPGKFEINNSHAQNWLDGFAQLYSFVITGGTVSFSTKLLKSSFYKKSCEAGAFRPLCPNSGKSFFSRCVSAFTEPTEPYDNVNINIAQYGNHYVALTETPAPLAFDPTTLKTIKTLPFNDTLGGHFCCAHPHFDHATNQWINFFITFGNTSTYTIYTMKKDGTKRKVLGSFNVDRPAYMHSFAITQRYIILTEAPYTLNPLDLIFGDKSFLDNFTWQPERGTRFIVFDKKTGAHLGNYTTDAFFAFHHVNAFDDNTSITLDIATYDDPTIMGCYAFKNIHKKKFNVPHTKLERFVITLKKDNIQRTTLVDGDIEMPRINDHCCGRSYRYSYGVSHRTTHTMANSITKIDVKNKNMCYWQEQHCYPSEPIFVAKPGSQQEDEGVLLSVVLDAKNKNSFLVILNAHTMQEIARATLADHIPFTVHGNFYPINQS